MDNTEAMQQFEAYLRRRYPDRRTPVSYLSDMRQFQHLCTKTWDAVTPQDVDLFVDQMRQAGLKPATCNHRVITLKVYIDVLADVAGCLDHVNPVHLKRHCAKLGRHLPRDLSDTDVARLLGVVQAPRDQALVALLLEAGLRVSELIHLTRADLRLPTAPQALARLLVLGKGQKERMVYLSPHALSALSVWLTTRPAAPQTTLFVNERHLPLTASGVEWILNQYGTQLGLHLTPHRLRHTFARRLIEESMPVESLSCLMGHEQITTTQLYLAGANPELRADFDAAMQRLASATPPAAPPPVPLASAVPSPASPPRRPPAEPVYPPPPDETAWATDLPEAIRQACCTYVQRHLSGWRPSQRRKAANRVYYDFARCFRFVLQRRSITLVSDLSRADLQAYVDALVAQGFTPMGVKDALSRVLGLLHELQEQGQPIAPSVFRVQKPTLPDPLPRALDEAARRQVVALAQQWTQEETPLAACQAAWFFVLADTGLRACELSDLRLADVDLPGRRLMVRAGKGDRDRVVYLTAGVAQLVRRYLDLYPHPDSPLLFIHPNTGRPLTYAYLSKQLAALAKAANVPSSSAHCLRHTFATRLINAGVPITSLQKLLGHAHLSTTQIYARVYDATVERDYRQAMARLEQSPVGLSADQVQPTAAVRTDASAVKVLDNSV